MNVLLLTHNHTVEEMVSLALREREGLDLVRGDDAEMVGSDYDVVIVDDTFPQLHEAWLFTQEFHVPHTVVLAQRGSLTQEPFAHRVTKPFLPEEIADLMDRLLTSDSSLPPQKKKAKKKKSKKKQKAFKAETEVLNLDEIETIKTLLEEEGLEIVNEEELAQKVLSDEEARETAEQKQHDALLKALRKMKPKKIRKLLKGAHVTIEIRFPKDNQ